ncbi:hypothetical protein [Nocardia sp. NPDC057440]|uniref:hypothetical protein n=1 Tax=Nocardia sp. NPDC057440 TaxID=3346134 RepID=UPI0036701094
MAQTHARLILSWRQLDELAKSADQVLAELVTEAMEASGIAYPHHRDGAATGLKLLTLRLGRTEQSLVIEVSEVPPGKSTSIAGLEFSQQVVALSHRYGRFRSGDGTVTTWCELTAARTTSPIRGIQ